MRSRNESLVLVFGSGIGLLANLIEGFSRDFTVWNVIAILVFCALMGVGLRGSRQIP
jgi:hypothetical protein